MSNEPIKGGAKGRAKQDSGSSAEPERRESEAASGRGAGSEQRPSEPPDEDEEILEEAIEDDEL